MSKSKITPGLWVFGKRMDGSKWLSLGNPSAGTHYQGDMCCSDADAHLIVSAPDLLDFVKTLENDDNKIPAWLWEKRNELIAKAEGRDQ